MSSVVSMSLTKSSEPNATVLINTQALLTARGYACQRLSTLDTEALTIVQYLAENSYLNVPQTDAMLAFDVVELFHSLKNAF